ATSKLAKGHLGPIREESKFLSKIEASKELIDAMGELKGAFMKIGQMLSLTEDMVLPDEVSALFKKLQREAPPMTEKELNSVFLDEFKKPPEEIFKSFERTPMAAASIGQVHRGVLKTGENVAIKIQYPNIQQAIKNDFKNVKAIERFFKLLLPNLPEIKDTIEEIKESIINECDYELEASEARFFKENLEKEFSNIIVPKVFDEFSNKRILTMELMKGEHFDETLKYSQSDRNRLGQTLFDCYMYSLYKLNKIHSDPQNGNYLFNKDKIIILDFGSTKTFSEEFVLLYLRLLLSIEKNDLKEYKETTIKLGLCLDSDSEEFFKEHFEFVSRLYGPYQKSGYYPIDEKVNPFKSTFSFIKNKSLKGRSPQKDLFLLDRSTLGLFTKLKAWQSKVNWTESKDRYRKELIEKIKPL
ncbi:MAG: ABC1 kinase family protein, partial [Bacteriovoracaceae bacterium]